MNKIIEIPYKIHGIPCVIAVTAYYPPIPADRYTPRDEAEVDYVILDRGGHIATWLERKITPEIDADIREKAVSECST